MGVFPALRLSCVGILYALERRASGVWRMLRDERTGRVGDGKKIGGRVDSLTRRLSRGSTDFRGAGIGGTGDENRGRPPGQLYREARVGLRSA